MQLRKAGWTHAGAATTFYDTEATGKDPARMLYHAYELTHAAIGPMRAAAKLGRYALSNPLNPVSVTLPAGSTTVAMSSTDWMPPGVPPFSGRNADNPPEGKPSGETPCITR